VRKSRRTAEQITGGNPDRAAAAVRKNFCGSCHTIPGLDGTNAWSVRHSSDWGATRELQDIWPTIQIRSSRGFATRTASTM
jgi:hypothetical protein